MATTVFYIFAAVALLSAVMCILQRNAVAAAMWLVSTMFSLSGIYVLLQAQFIAAIQVLVYAGAVMVLFLFVIMLLNVGGSQSDVRGPPTVAATVVVVGLLAAELFALWQYTPARLARELAQGPEFADPRLAFPNALVAGSAANGNIVRDVAGPLFETYLIPFEVTSILLLAAIVGAVVLAKRKI
jgi:NADH-quinone oxidoreductase subunit J